MAVKCWATYLALERISNNWATIWRQRTRGGRRHAGRRDDRRACATGRHDPGALRADNPGYISRILPAIEGLIYPLVWRMSDALDASGPFATMLDALNVHTMKLLKQTEDGQPLRATRDQALEHIEQFVDEQDRVVPARRAICVST
jgi:hypothetical protein